MTNPIALLLLVPLLTAQLVMPAESACPAGMTPVGAQPWCVQYYDQPVTFCNAVKKCHENGQEMISKPVYDAMKDRSDIQVGQWWVGLVDALNERGTTHKDGWVWIKDGQVTTGSESDFNSGEPNDNDNQDCVTIKDTSHLLRDATCNDDNKFYCYLDDSVANRFSAKSNTGKFERVEIAAYQQPDPGCWIKEPSAITIENCILSCFKFEFGDCVGFYWHPDRRQCALLPYFDANLPLDQSDFSANELEKMQWKKYRRTDG